jgi:hypothetical protein
VEEVLGSGGKGEVDIFVVGGVRVGGDFGEGMG